MSRYYKLKSANFVFDEINKIFYPIDINENIDNINKFNITEMLDKEIWKSISFEDKEYIKSKIEK